jgi:hypothetical protein
MKELKAIQNEEKNYDPLAMTLEGGSTNFEKVAEMLVRQFDENINKQPDIKKEM